MKNNTHCILLYFIFIITISQQTWAMVQPTPTATPQLTMNLYDDFQHAFQRPPSPKRGDSSFENVQLVQDCIIASIGINPNANPLDNFVPHQDTSTHIPEVTVLEAASIPVVITQENNSVPFYSVDNTDIGHHISRDVVGIEQHRDSHNTDYQMEYRSLDVSNWRELDCKHNQYGEAQDNSSKEYTTRNIGNNKSFWANQIPIRERFIYLLLPSNNPKALSAQLKVTQSSTLGISQEYFPQSVQNKYRNFLWDASGHFKPIDSPERQAQAFKILYPAIKAYFATNRIGLLHFLKENTNISGAEKQYKIETEWGSYFTSNLNSLAVIPEKLNIFEGNVTKEMVTDSAFVQKLCKLATLIEQGRLVEAKEMLTQSGQKIYSTNANNVTRNAMIQEHHCLCAQYTALTAKMFDKYKGDPHYQVCDRFLQRGSMSLTAAYKILDARHQAAHSLAYRMGYNPKNLSAKDRNLIFKEIDSRTKDTFGLKDLYEHKELLTDQELTKLKEKLECFEPLQKKENSLDRNATSAIAQANSESTAVVPKEETEPIERPAENVQQEVSVTTSPPPLEPKEPKEKEENQADSQNREFKRVGIKQTSIYQNALESIQRNAHRFTKLSLEQLSKDKLKHIINNHYKIGEVAKSRLKNSVFNENIDLIDVILTALEFGAEIEPGVIAHDCGKIIGHSQNGNPTSIIQVCLDKTKTIIKTSFPG